MQPPWDHVIAASAGNDSAELVRWCHEHRERHGIENPVVMYVDTRWAYQSWEARVRAFEEYVQSLGWPFVRLQSIGMTECVRRYGYGYPPLRKARYCTAVLKITTILDWLDSWDPECEAINMRGIRREESDRRRDAPEWQEGTGPVDWRSRPKAEQLAARGRQRTIWQPLVRLTRRERDLRLQHTPLAVLDHRSRECMCINSSKADIRALSEADVQVIEQLERSETERLGRSFHLFSPAEHGDQEGIRAVLRWAHTDRGSRFVARQTSLCDLGWCGT